MKPQSPFTEVFDPLAVENVGITLALELLEQSTHPLRPLDKFTGPGVYVLYYDGDHPAYAPLRTVNLDDPMRVPVYVGRALREKARSGFVARPSHKSELRSRIQSHARSIEATNNLNAEDFRCRYLVLSDAYIALAESVLITLFRPPWNGMGLGSNMTGGPRMNGKASLWDSLHPGRKGRPAGTAPTAKIAAERIASTLDMLASPHEDERTARTVEKIRKRLGGSPP